MSIPLTVISPAETAACCAPLTAQPLSVEQAGQVAPLLKALGDPVRLRLLSLVASHEGAEANRSESRLRGAPMSGFFHFRFGCYPRRGPGRR